MRRVSLFVVLMFLVLSFAAVAKTVSIRLDAPYFDNSTTTNVADYIGKKPVLLVFFYPDCPPCEKEAEEINKIYKKYRDKVSVLGISLSRDRYAIGDFIKNQHVKYPIWRIHSMGDLRNVGGILATPTIVILDRNGKIVKKYVGEIKGKVIEKVLNKLLLKEEGCQNTK